MAFKIFGFSFRDFLDKKMNNAKYVSMNYGVQASYKMLAIHIAASYIANALSKCEFVTYKGGKRTREEDYYRLNVEPNNNQNGSQFWNKVFMKMLTEPEGALVICTDTGKMYVADSFSREAYPFTEDRFTSIVIDGVNLYKSYPASEVFYFKLEDENVVQFINGMYEDYGQAITYAMKAYKKANGQKYKLKLAADKTGDKDFEQKYKEYLETGLKEFIESDNGIYPENKGYSLEVFNQGQQSKDSQDLINLRKDIFSAAGQAFKIPQSMMDGNINNLKDVVNSFLTFAVEPVADMANNETSRKLYGYMGFKDNTYIKIDTSQIPFNSILENADQASKLIANTICNPDEVRNLFGFDDINEDFSKSYFITKNNSKAEDVMNNVSENGKE